MYIKLAWSKAHHLCCSYTAIRNAFSLYWILSWIYCSLEPEDRASVQVQLINYVETNLLSCSTTKAQLVSFDLLHQCDWFAPQTHRMLWVYILTLLVFSVLEQSIWLVTVLKWSNLWPFVTDYINCMSASSNTTE